MSCHHVTFYPFDRLTPFLWVGWMITVKKLVNIHLMTPHTICRSSMVAEFFTEVFGQLANLKYTLFSFSKRKGGCFPLANYLQFLGPWESRSFPK